MQGVRSIEWAYDSQWAHNVACGTCKSSVHRLAARLAQALLVALTQRFCFFGRWVKGHGGDVWNDRADVLAKDGARRKLLTHCDAVRGVPVHAVCSELLVPLA